MVCCLSEFCMALTMGHLAESADTPFPSLADATMARAKLAQQTFDGTTSPRLSSRLARRPTGDFPYAMQPFHVMPLPPGDDHGISVTEANRRLRQAQALSERQHHFGQLIDLASTGQSLACVLSPCSHCLSALTQFHPCSRHVLKKIFN